MGKTNENDVDNNNQNLETPNNPTTTGPTRYNPATLAELEKCFTLQRMNYHATQLPRTLICPGAPLLGNSRQLPEIIAPPPLNINNDNDIPHKPLK